MFEMIRPYQNHFCDVIEQDIRRERFPQAVLFSGPRYSLKMTSALETVRVLSCKEKGEEDCHCASCKANSLLGTSNLIILSQRDHASILTTYLGVYKRLRNNFSKNQLIRATRIFLLGYHGALLKGVSASLKPAFEAAGGLNDLLLQLGSLREDDQKGAMKFEKEYLDALKKIQSSGRKDSSLSIEQVRAIEEWTIQTTEDGQKQFVILEEVERSGESARNSLLKLLEEPPEGVYFILLSTHPERLMQTILSRVRRYRFVPLEPEGVKRLLAPNYPPHQFESFDAFFLSGSGSDAADLFSWAGKLKAAAVENTYLSSADVAQLCGICNSQSALEYFLHALLGFYEQDFLAGRIPLKEAQRVSSLVSAMERGSDLYNQDRRMLLQNLSLKLVGRK